MPNMIVKLTSITQAPPRSGLERENLALKARVAELEQLVVRDTLTPLFNRRYFIDELNRWCSRSNRYGGDYGLLFIDVDSLKAVNDQHGHLAGDVVLTAVANALLALVRRSDIVARVGGDEFAILLVNISIDKLSRKAEHISDTMRQLEVPYQGARLTPNVSVGFTPLEPGVRALDLIMRADRSMYAAKQAKSADAPRKSATQQ